ncbi:hypothetical protein FACS1894216_19310 [Synergistales bacterium]|nr:hypothetical protein FACS1894216_19310 [Synergistales bacterium]
MMESAIGKVAEKAVEKTPTFFDKLESAVEVAKSDLAKKSEAVSAFWEDIDTSVENLSTAEKDSVGEMPNDKDLSEKSEYNKRIDQTPINNGEWTGDRAKSIWIPDDGTILHDKLTEKGVKGIEYVDGYPDFSPIADFETTLEEKDFGKTDSEHKAILCKDLKDKIDSDPIFAKNFTSIEKEIINDGKIPSRFVVHHGTNPGQLQLVDKTIHEKCGHVGGRNIWGGGTANRAGGKQ